MNMGFVGANNFSQEDDFGQSVAQPSQLPVYGAYNSAAAEDEIGHSKSFVAKTPAESLLLQQKMMAFPTEEDIIMATGIIASKIDLENLPVAAADVEISSEQKKQMEADPVYKMLEDHFYKVFDRHIFAHTSAISSKIESFEIERSFVHKRIEEIAKTELNCKRIVVKVFGSLKTGLALESSDMDMAITGLEITDRQTLIEDMHTLTEALDSWDLVKEIKSIETASIPVIKAKIDLVQIRKLLKAQSNT